MPNLPRVLTDGEITLREYRLEDVDRIVEFANDPRSRRWLPLPDPYGDQQAREFVELMEQEWYTDPVHPSWVIDVDGRYVGGTNARRTAPDTWEIGYSMHPDARGRGLMTKAARLVVDALFDRFDARTVTWRAARGNFASRRVAWSLGMTVDGTWPRTHATGEDADGTWFGHLHREDRDRTPAPWWVPALLRGDHVTLRPWRDDDTLPAEPVVPGPRLGLQQIPTADTFAEWLLTRRESMADSAGVYWCIADADTDDVLGSVHVDRLDEEFTHGTGAVAYWLLPAARGRGVVQDALDLLIPHAFAPRTDDAGLSGLGLRRLEAGIDSRNHASRRTLLRAGFHFWGAEREVLGYGGDCGHDAESFELLATDDRDAQRVTPLTVPTLRTERLVLREWTEADSPTPDQVTDDDARRFMAGGLPTPESYPLALQRRRQGADRGTMLSWCITDATNGEVLGNVALFSIGEGTATNAELGYWLWQQARGRGVTAEAVGAVLDHAFGELGLTRVHAETDLENIASHRVLLRHGFRQWGTDRQAYTNADGSATDGAYFELLATDRRTAQTADLPPLIHGDAVRLRPLRACDVDRAHEACIDPEYVTWLGGDTSLTRERTRGWVARETAVTADRLRWVITDSSDEFLGCVTVQNIDRRVGTAEIGYWVHPDARGRGLATAAVRAVVAHAFSTEGMDLNRLSLAVADGNDASLAVARAAGFVECGRDRRAESLGDGRVVDLLRFDLLREQA